MRQIGPKSSLYILLHSSEARNRISTALHQHARVVIVERIEDLCRSLSVRPLETKAIILDAIDRYGYSTLPAIHKLRHDFPNVPVVAYYTLGARQTIEAWNALKAGAHAILVSGRDDTGIALRAKIREAEQVNVREAVRVAFTSKLPAPIHPLVHVVCTRDRHNVDIEDVARALRLHRRSLGYLCTRYHLPPPRTLIAWCRLGIAIETLARFPATVEAIALEMAFPSATALRNQLKRHTGLTATEARARGGVSHFTVLLAAHRAGQFPNHDEYSLQKNGV